MKIYLSGGITKVENYRQVFNRAEDRLRMNGLKIGRGKIPGEYIDIVNPIKLEHDHDKSYWSYIRECVVHLAKCNSIYMLKGWWKSKGARIELMVALLLNISVGFEHE